ncbi:MAG: 30S ribosomal protein S8 [Magnetococcales bacterium]|nr:30S ribosomal protein S8 [Magnetococcales bacterium]
MGMTDPISDMLTRIRNAHAVRKEVVEIPASKIKARIGEILVDEGYVEAQKVVEREEGGNFLQITLKYHKNKPVIEKIERRSRPGMRVYVGVNDIPSIYNGLGISILSTSHGVISNREAKKLGVGGELLCAVF